MIDLRVSGVILDLWCKFGVEIQQATKQKSSPDPPDKLSHNKTAVF